MEEIIYDNKKFIKYISRDDISSRITFLSSHINADYYDKKILFIGVLKGCLPFTTDLLKKIKIDYDVDYIKLSSYKGTKRGEIVFEKSTKIKDFSKYDNVIILEDIIDSGSTINHLKLFFNKIKNKLQIVALLTKEKNMHLCDWYGFKVENKYVIGYGLDINNLFRELKDIYIEER